MRDHASSGCLTIGVHLTEQSLQPISHTNLRKFLDRSVPSISGRIACTYGAGEAGAQATAQSERTRPWLVANRFQAISQASMTCGGLTNTEPMAAQIVPDPLDRVELRAVGRQLQQCDIAGHHETLAPMPPGTIEDHHGMGISGDLGTDLAEMMVHGCGIADRHDQRRRFALRRADRAKHIGRGEAEILWCCRPAAGLPHTRVRLFF